MQIVINVPDYIKEQADDGKGEEFGIPLWLAYEIANGTPLPKGHGRLIDADKAISKICGGSCGCHLEECGFDEPCFSVTRIESVSTIIEADKGESEESDEI